MYKKNNLVQKSLRTSAFLAILSTGLSISATHIFIAFSFLFFLIGKSLKINFTNRNEQNIKKPYILYAGFSYYCYIIISMFFHGFQASDTLLYFTKAANAEVSDIALFLFACLVYKLHGQQKYQKTIEQSFYILAAIIVVTGFISIFSEFRLGRLIQGLGSIASSINRPQHPVFSISGITLHQPIGFMNTHLTYAGILIIGLTIFLHSLLQNLKVFLLSDTINKQFIYSIAGTTMACIVLFFNQARSILLGFVLFIPLFIWLFFNQFLLVKQTSLKTFIKNNKVKIILLLISTILTFPFAYKNIQSSNTLSIKHTDYSRPLIWKSSFEIIKQNAIIGIGSGNFKKVTWKWRQSFLQNNPDLLYHNHNAPDGHAHNDLLHTGVIAGIPAMFFYLMIVYLIALKIFNRKKDMKITFLSIGLIIISLGGVFQCFFQDDEVIVLFWCIVAWISSLENTNRGSEIVL